MVLLGTLPEHDLAVVEIGTSLPGEVAALTDVARPDVAVLTRIAVEHAEGLGDLDAIEEEEGAILRGLAPQAVAVVNGDDERCSRQLERSPASRQIRYGRSGLGLAYRIESIDTTRTGRTGVVIRRPRGPTLHLETELVGLPAAYALTAGLAAAESVLSRPLEPDEARSGALAREMGEPGRLGRCELVDGSLLLDDSYNSSPASARSSVDAAAELARQRGARLLLVLGEMRELGRFAQSEHRDLGQYLADLAPSLVIAFGGHAERVIEAPARAGIEAVAVADAPAAADVALGRRRAGDVILVKASRSLRAERIVQALAAGASPEQAEPPAEVSE
jgi:UDP-N-acetylmuramoyl-tripeptide--D-alanyl-D-alanine ligase